MKKTFITVLRTMCVGAMALFAVSCYDDSALTEGLAGLKDRVDGIEARLDSLEKALNADVKTINGLIAGLDASTKENAAAVAGLVAQLDALDGKVDGYIESNDAAIKKAIEDFKKANEALAAVDTEILAQLAAVGVTNVAKNEAGDVVLTFTDGSTLVVPTTPQEGLVTVVEVEGVKYWAVIVEGEAVSLEVPVGHPSLEFQIEDNELLYSVDGGNEWVSTGAYVADDMYYFFSDFYQGAEFDYDLWEEVLDPYYTLVFGGEEYYLPVYKVDNSVVTLKAGKTYFTYGETKTVEVALTDITSIYVMTKPEGWRANLEGKVLTVVAPDSARVASGYAEADGEVLLHCTTVDGLCKIARLAVATTPGFNLTVDEEGNLKIVNPLVDLDSYEFVDAYVGFADVAEFEADPVAYVEAASTSYDKIVFTVGNWKFNTMDWETGEFTIGGQYDPETYAVDVIETTVEDAYLVSKYIHGNDAIPAGTRFVVWACPMDAMGNPQTTDIVFAYYSKPVEVAVEPAEASFTDVEVSVEVVGASTYYVGMVTEEMTYGFPIDSYMQNQEGPFGYFQKALEWGYDDYAFMYMGTLYENPGEALTITASELNYGEPLLPNTKFYMWVFPVVDGLPLADYTYEDNLQPFIYEFTTSGLEAGGTLTATFGEPTLSFTNINVPVSAEGAALVYYNFYDVEEYNEIADVAADLMENGYVSPESDFAAIANNLTPGVSRKLAIVVVDEDGLYGEVVAETFTTPAITYSETFKATVGEITIEEGSYYSMVTIPVTVEGGEAAKYYWYFNGAEKTEEWLKENLPLGKYPCSSGKTLSKQYAYFNSYATYQFAVVVESTTGEYSAPVIVKVNKPASVEGEVENPAN